MREIVLDTETTGLDPRTGDRIVEIGCIELVGLVPKAQFQRYVNPERPVPPEVVAIHGLTDEFLSDKPLFAEIVGEFLDFIGDAPIVSHNAPFDLGFLNAELRRAGIPEIPRSRTVDTLDLARRRHPGANNRLDALCQRYGIDNSRRVLHGALLDAQLLSEVYLELRGGRQPGLVLVDQAAMAGAPAPAAAASGRRPRVIEPTEAEMERHAALVKTLRAPLWAS